MFEILERIKRSIVFLLLPPLLILLINGCSGPRELSNYSRHEVMRINQIDQQLALSGPQWNKRLLVVNLNEKIHSEETAAPTPPSRDDKQVWAVIGLIGLVVMIVGAAVAVGAKGDPKKQNSGWTIFLVGAIAAGIGAGLSASITETHQHLLESDTHDWKAGFDHYIQLSFKDKHYSARTNAQGLATFNLPDDIALGPRDRITLEVSDSLGHHESNYTITGPDLLTF